MPTLAKENAEDELKKLPQDVVYACSVRLLCVATNKLELIEPGWSVSITNLAVDDLTPHALPILDKPTRLLAEQKRWQIFLDYRVGEFLSTVAHRLINQFSPISDLKGAMARGLYAQGAAALGKGDNAAAKKAWGMAKIYAKDSNDPALALCQQGLAKLG